MFSLFKSRLKLPASFDRWSEVDVVVSSDHLHSGPSVLHVRTLKRWLEEYSRWRAGYDEFIRAERTLLDGGFTDDFDHRQFEHYAALFIQTGQWHAMLLALLEDAPEAERSRYLTEIDGFLADLRKKIGKA
jgi:hypothetical protein